ncbi:hypothetical protein F4802DRAFT_617361 [Xylaria palmicola]|nr:hypothetical protein F4802DRAFT_617361 [Xylaria palmicola]
MPMMSRRRESQLRLEVLGGLSDHYSEVVSASASSTARPADHDEDDIDSNGSRESTTAVIFDKAPPPGIRIKKRAFSDSMGPVSSSERRYIERPFSVTPSLANKPYVICANAGQPLTIDTSQLRPAKCLRRSQHLASFNPGAISHHINREYYGDDRLIDFDIPSVLRPGFGRQESAQRSTSRQDFEAINQYNSDLEEPAYGDGLRQRQGNESGITNHAGMESDKLSYHLSSAQGHRASPQAEIYSSNQDPGAGLRSRSPNYDLCESPEGYDWPLTSQSFNDTVPNNNHAAQPFRSDSNSIVGNPTTPQFQPSRPPTRATMRVDGVEFEMVSPNLKSLPSPSPFPSRSPFIVNHAPMNQDTQPIPITRSQSPAYGALDPDRSSPQSASFIDRARAHLDHSIQGQLIKVGWKPYPNFKVNKVVKSPTTCNVQVSEDVFKKRTLNPSLVEPSWQERMQNLARELEMTKRKKLVDVLPVTSTPVTERQTGTNEFWGISGSNQNEPETLTPSQIPAVSDAVSYPMNMNRGEARNLRINTGFGGSLIPRGVVELEAPLQVFSFDDESEDWGSGTSRSAFKRSSDESLFLDDVGSELLRSPATYSFFSSEYSQRRIMAADTERNENPPPPPRKRLHRARSASSLYRADKGEAPTPCRPKSSYALAREYLEFASLPSPFEDLAHPFPFDRRHNLPIRTKHPGQFAIRRRPVPGQEAVPPS